MKCLTLKYLVSFLLIALINPPLISAQTLSNSMHKKAPPQSKQKSQMNPKKDQPKPKKSTIKEKPKPKNKQVNATPKKSAVKQKKLRSKSKQKNINKKSKKSHSNNKFIDRNGDGIHDGMEHRFRKKPAKRKRGTLGRSRQGSGWQTGGYQLHQGKTTSNPKKQQTNGK